jgi:hypothetical protein
MRFVKFFTFIIFLFCVFSCQKRDVDEIVPGYKLIRNFSDKIKPKTKLVLFAYGINVFNPKGYKLINHIGCFDASYTIRSDLDVYPFTADRLHMSLCIVDENKVELGQGIAKVYFSRGKIEYERYDISEYTGRCPAKGKYFTVHEESYEEALKIVKEQNCLTLF